MADETEKKSEKYDLAMMLVRHLKSVLPFISNQSERILIEKTLIADFPKKDREMIIPELEKISGQKRKTDGSINDGREKQGGPGEIHGRRRLRSYKRGKAWYCLEEVPCGKTNCRKNPDLHGPYWYKYYRDEKSGQWKPDYIGREIPFEDADVSDQVLNVKRRLWEMSVKETLSEEDMWLCGSLLREIAPIKGKETGRLREEIGRIEKRYERQREDRIRASYEIIADKIRNDEKLTEEERDAFERYSEFLSGKH
jgi:hypothetical protein